MKRFSAFCVIVVALIAAMMPSVYAGPSGKMPVMYINTENSEPITSKDVYLQASYWLDPCGVEGVEAFGSEAEPLALQIRGRGNYTWKDFDKKPYRIKFDKKTPILGMKKSKHFALLAHADDNLGFLRNDLGFELSRRMGLAWTPTAEPVEVVLNGDYIGLYFLTETIRVDADRVNIVEQADNETDPEKITGGWLVEIDNYNTDPHVTILENGDSKEQIWFTYKTPEELSAEQENYLRSSVQAVDDAIYGDETDAAVCAELERLVDIDELARFYIVQEIMDDCESFHGSCYLYRDQGADSKWKFGPVWDFGNSFRRGEKGKFIYDEPAFHQVWIGKIAKFAAFQDKVKALWKEFAESGCEGLTEWIDAEVARMSAAAEADAERWSDYGNPDLVSRGNKMKRLYINSTNWLAEKWGTPMPDQMPTVYLRGTFNKWQTTDPFTFVGNGIYEISGINMASDATFKIATSGWDVVNLGATPDVALEIGVEYPLTDIGENIPLPTALENATFRLNLNAKTVLVTMGGNSVNVIDGDTPYTVSGNLLNASVPVVVYNVAGVSVWQGVGSVRLNKGIYIIVAPNGNVSKVIMR